MKRRLLIAFLVLLATSAPAQDTKLSPELTEVQKMRIQNVALTIEVWQLRAQQAAAELEKARKALNELVANSTPSGYVLNDKLELVPIPKPKD